MEVDGQQSFIDYLKARQKKRPGSGRVPNKIIVQIVHQPRLHIVLSRFLPLLQSHYSARAIATDKVIAVSLRQFARSVWRTAHDWTLGRSTFGVYRALGCQEVLVPRSSARMRWAAKNFSHSFLRSNPTKDGLEQLCIDGVIVGDLVYDAFLRIGHPTVDFGDPGMRDLLTQAHLQVTYWRAKLKQRIAAVIADSVYLNAIIARVAIHSGVPVYGVAQQALYRLDKNYPVPEREDRFFHRISDGLGLASKKDILAQGQTFIQSRIDGKIDHRISFMESSPYSREAMQEQPSLPKPSVLIAAHDFFDSPHVFGTAFYPDFFEWCTTLNEIALRSEVPWVVKPHPRSSEPSIQLLWEIFGKNPNCTIVARTASIDALVRGGVRYVTTVYGTIASEVPLIGVTVLLASSRHKYVDFGFGPTFNDRFEYENALSNVQHVNFEIDPTNFFLFHYFDGVKTKDWGFLSQFWERFDAACVARGANHSETYGGPLTVDDEAEFEELERCVESFLSSSAYRTNWSFQQGSASADEE